MKAIEVKNCMKEFLSEYSDDDFEITALARNPRVPDLWIVTGTVNSGISTKVFRALVDAEEKPEILGFGFEEPERGHSLDDILGHPEEN